MTLLELTVVILVLLGLIGVLFIGVSAWKKGADRTACIMNIRNVQQATRAHANLEKLNSGDPLNMIAELIGSEKFLQESPICPSMGIYTEATAIPPLGTLALTCSLATLEEHVPKVYGDW